MNLSLDTPDEEIIGAIRAKYNHYYGLSNKYKKMLDAYDGVPNSKTVSISDKDTIFGEEVIKPAKTKRFTFEDKVVSILRGGRPLRSLDLNKAYYNTTGEEITPKDFSSKLSIRASNSGSKIKLAKFPSRPFEERFWWCLTEWFKGGELKPEFLEKIDSYIAKAKTDQLRSA